MKNIYKYMFLALIATSALFYSCETFELEQVNNPNVLPPDQADPTFLLNRIQTDYRSAIVTFNDLGADLGRIDNMFGGNYLDNYGDTTLNNPWQRLYSGIVPDIKAIEGFNSSETNLSFHIGVAKTLQAHLMMLMVDFVGDVPFSEINQPVQFPNPSLDDDESVYEAAIAILDEATVLINSDATNVNAEDLYFDGDNKKWIKLINTLKMRANLTTGKYTDVINAENVIENTSDDFAFTYGTNVQNPDTRHPDYDNDYTTSGANIYQSNWLMNLMLGPEVSALDDINTDPRRRYYFYRQSPITPGNKSFIRNLAGTTIILDVNNANAETLDCSLEQTPEHIQFTEQEDYWCSTRYGYWGRDHGSDDGVPPDGFIRTAVGVYPAGGLFDDNLDFAKTVLDKDGKEVLERFPGVDLGAGAGGLGIEPIYLASYVDFMKAEATLATGGDAAGLIRSGLEKSIAKVQSFGMNDPSADLSLAPTASDVTNWINAKIIEFEAAPATSGLDGNGYPTTKSKMDILGELYFTTLYGGAADAFNFIRRTGAPRTYSRNLARTPGNFPRTVLYPNVEVSTNPNVLQRETLDTKVFWDNGIINPGN